MESFWRAFLIHLAEIPKPRLWCCEQGTGSAFWFGRLVFLRGQRPGHFEARETPFQSRKSHVLWLLRRVACFRIWVLKCVIWMVAIADGWNDCMPAALMVLIALQWNRIDRKPVSPGKCTTPCKQCDKHPQPELVRVANWTYCSGKVQGLLHLRWCNYFLPAVAAALVVPCSFVRYWYSWWYSDKCPMVMKYDAFNQIAPIFNRRSR